MKEQSDEGRQLFFIRHDLPIHHFVTDGHHGQIKLGVLASNLLQGGVEPGGKDLGGALLELFGLLLQLISSFLQLFSFPASLSKVFNNLFAFVSRLGQAVFLFSS